MRAFAVLFFFLQSAQVFSQPDTTVYTIVDKMPEFPGGDKERGLFIRDNIQIPQEYKESRTSGIVYVSFIVEETGKVRDVRVLKGATDAPLYDAEAARLISIMPDWIPGEHNGKKVAVQLSLPIKATLLKEPPKTKK